MADQQVPQTQTPVQVLTAPPSLQLLQDDAGAGLCTDGYCVLPQTAASE
ncbi:hypothetical protein [Microbacterium sp.]|jgi:hypothetical protein